MAASEKEKEEEMKKLLDAPCCACALGACFSPRATFDANLSISPGGVKRHYPLLPLPPSFSLYRELVPRMRNCLKLLAPPHCTPLPQH